MSTKNVLTLEDRRFKVYKATSPSGNVYIGLTCQEFKKRKNKHISDASCGCNTKFKKAIRKYTNSILWEVLEYNLTVQEAKELEVSEIKKYNSYKKGYNSTLGGDIPYNIGVKKDRESVEKQIRSLKQYYKNPENIRKNSERVSKYYSTREARNKAAISHGSKKFNVYEIETGNYIGSWYNQVLCSEELTTYGVIRTGVGKCLRGEMNTHKGLRFIYEY